MKKLRLRRHHTKVIRPKHWIIEGVILTLVGVLGWSMLGLVVSLAVLWIVGVLLGIDVYGSTTSVEDAQLLLAITIVVGAIFFWLWRRLRHKTSFHWRIQRRILIICVILGFLGGMIGTIASYVAIREDARTSCILPDYLGTALGATYPVGTELGSGTAFAVDANGTLVTAYHVIDGAKEVFINLDSGKIPVQILKTAPDYDLAVLKVDMPTDVYLPLDTTYALTDQVYAFGWPGNTFDAGSASVSSGIVSRLLTEQDLKNSGATIPAGLQMVQTDAAVNPGNSGGPLVGACGAVGVVDAKSDSLGLQEYGVVSEEGISYAISAQTVKTVLGL